MRWVDVQRQQYQPRFVNQFRPAVVRVQGVDDGANDLSGQFFIAIGLLQVLEAFGQERPQGHLRFDAVGYGITRRLVGSSKYGMHTTN